MELLITYALVALVFSFLCSIAEAVVLSVSAAHVSLLQEKDPRVGNLLREFKEEINRPLTAILTLNTIAHTVGAVGVGAQAAAVFGSGYVGIASAVLTLLILVCSEIIPKTLGAHYWKNLLTPTVYALGALVWLLHPFIKLSEKLMGALVPDTPLTGFNRSEFAAMADLSVKDGKLIEQESRILKNLLVLGETRVRDAMTPRSVVFSLQEDLRVEEFFHKYDHERFSRIPLYRDNPDTITGFVLRSDLLLAQARGNAENPLNQYVREMVALTGSTSLSRALDQFLQARSHMILVVDGYGSTEGILTLEDVLETLLGLEFVDEGDKDVDMQKLARNLWRRRAKAMGIVIDQ